MGRSGLKFAVAAGAALLASLPMAAQAAVTYSFVADSSYPFNDVTITGGFTLTVASPISGPTTFPLASLDSCSVSASDGSAIECIGQQFASYDGLYDQIGFGTDGSEARYTFYNFAVGAFSANGVYETITFGANQHGFLTVSGIGDTGGGGATGGVPEPATWALMILGFGAAGAALRRRGLVQPA